jgi:hypothetical protein
MSAVCNDSGKGRGVASWLSLAATPTFAAMALVTGLSSGGAAMTICGMADMAPSGFPSMCGMVPMYLLMSLFHAAPWVRLFGKHFRG